MCFSREGIDNIRNSELYLQFSDTVPVERKLPPPPMVAARSLATATASRGGRPLLSSTLSHFVRFPGRMSITFAAAMAAGGMEETFATGGVITANKDVTGVAKTA
jgi:hypothetical protein